MRTNELDIGTWLIKTEGDAAAVLAMDATLLQPNHWLVRETIGCCAAPSAASTSSRSLFALIEPGSCFAGLPRAGAGLRPAATCWLPDDAAKTPGSR